MSEDLRSTQKNEKVRRLIRVAILLSVATLIEFVIAFALEAGFIKTSLFVLLTLVKAFYIVGEFMHLAHEVKSLIWSIVFPMLFILFMLYALLYESSHELPPF